MSGKAPGITGKPSRSSTRRAKGLKPRKRGSGPCQGAAVGGGRGAASVAIGSGGAILAHGASRRRSAQRPSVTPIEAVLRMIDIAFVGDGKGHDPAIPVPVLDAEGHGGDLAVVAEREQIVVVGAAAGEDGDELEIGVVVDAA